MAENDGATADAGNNTETQAPEENGEAVRTFTQEDMNRVIADRVSRVHAKYADYDEKAAKAEKAEALQAAADEAQARAEAAEAAARRAEVAAAEGIPMALLNGPEDGTAEGLAAFAKALSDWRGSSGVPRPGSSALGEVGGTPARGSTADAFADFFRNNMHN